MNLIINALRRPVTILVAVIGIALASGLALTRMSVDIFPNLNLPVIYVAQPYGGMDPSQMESYLVSYYEYHFLYVTGIEHVESRSIQNVGLVKLFFHPGTDMSQALAQVVSYVERSRAFMPPGTVAPFVVRYDAGSVPVGNWSSRARRATWARFRISRCSACVRIFSTLPGVSRAATFRRQPAHGHRPRRSRQTARIPDVAGRSHQGRRGGQYHPARGQYPHGRSQSPRADQLRRLEHSGAWRVCRSALAAGRRSSCAMSATSRTASDILTGYGLFNEKRTVYIPVTKRADASTLDVVNRVKAELPRMQALIPEDIKSQF